MTIVTQDDVFVNYRYVKLIKFYAGELNDGENIQEVYQVVAVIHGKDFDEEKSKEESEESKKNEITLGYFDTNEAAQKVYADMRKWLNEKNDYRQLFEVPNFDFLLEEKSKESQKVEQEKQEKKQKLIQRDER